MHFPQIHGSPLRLAAARQLPQRGSLWRVGQVSPEQAKHNISETVVLRCLGQQQLDKVRCPEAAVLCSKARPFAPRRAFSVQTKADRHAKGSPFGRAGEELATRLRGLGCCQTALTQRSYRSDKEPAYRCAAALGSRACPLRHCFAMPPLPRGEALAGRIVSCIFLANYML